MLRWAVRGLGKLLPNWRLISRQEGLDQLAFATNRHFPKSFEPHPNRHFRLRTQPVRKQDQLFNTDLPFLYTINKVRPQASRQVVTTHAWHALIAVKAAG
jgi:hypothetical protein